MTPPLTFNGYDAVAVMLNSDNPVAIATIALQRITMMVPFFTYGSSLYPQQQISPFP